MAKCRSVNNTFYDDYGDRWYTADDDPVALLRAENRVKTPWILERVDASSTVLDVGCGAGFLANELAIHGHRVTGIDLSEQSLRVAQAYDTTRSVDYQLANAYDLPFGGACFDAVAAMDFLEHVDDPGRVIIEVARVLKPGGRFFFHTFNRNVLAHLVVIRLVEWLLPTTPEHMHVIELFIKPRELAVYSASAGMPVREWTGIRPVVRSIPLRKVFSGRVPESLRFTLTSNRLLSYMGMAERDRAAGDRPAVAREQQEGTERATASIPPPGGP